MALFMYYLATGSVCLLFALLLDHKLTVHKNPDFFRGNPDLADDGGKTGRPQYLVDAVAAVWCVIIWPLLLAYWLYVIYAGETLALRLSRQK